MWMQACIPASSEGLMCHTILLEAMTKVLAHFYYNSRWAGVILFFFKTLFVQVIWLPGRCITSSPCTSRTPATGLRSTRRLTPRCTGSPRPSTPCVTSCTAHRWNGRTPMWNPPKSPYKLRGEHCKIIFCLVSSFNVLLQNKIFSFLL